MVETTLPDCFGILYEPRARECQICYYSEDCSIARMYNTITSIDKYEETGTSEKRKEMRICIMEYVCELLKDEWLSKVVVIEAVHEKFAKGRAIAAKVLSSLKKEGVLDIKVENKRWMYRYKP